jgi:hypothetical protein
MAGTLHKTELDGIRVDQNAQLDAECIIWRTLSPGTISKVDATYTNPSTETIYVGPCYFAPIVSRRDRFDVHGEQQVYQNQNRVLLPWDAGSELGQEIRIGDLFRVTSSKDDNLDLRDQEIKDVLMVSDISLRRLTTIDIHE